jgi:hypothetical protein
MATRQRNERGEEAMNQEFILGRLSEIMTWDTERARKEFNWLRLMSRMKYDGYQDFLAGVRFIECLVDWLQQFSTEDRACAYDFVRNKLVYVSTAEMNHLVELFYPETVQRQIQNSVAAKLGIEPQQIWATDEPTKLFGQLLRQTLFIELSDGARIDVFRRANAGIISNEQIVTAPRINREKWNDLLAELKKDLEDDQARFASVYLIDDFVGSGTTLLREEDGTWKGKLRRFWEDVQEVLATHFEDKWSLCVHHYLGTHRARNAVHERQHQALTFYGAENWFCEIKFTFGAIFAQDLPLDHARHADFLRLADHYYDDSIETKHMKKGGDNAKLGFAKCALPLILEHNTPNNSLPLLWADTSGSGLNHPMRPLFRRRQRHA